MLNLDGDIEQYLYEHPIKNLCSQNRKNKYSEKNYLDI